MCRTVIAYISFVVLLTARCASGLGVIDIDFDTESHDFDLLIFTQQWPVTTCIEWMQTGQSHKCLLPSPKEIWTIHGVWPTRFGSTGPAFCNKTAKFDPDQILPLKDQMEQFWINIEKGQSLWSHEWLKHGTCASVLPELNNEKKYFSKGLSWHHEYSMSTILAKAEIIPDVPHTLVSIHDAVVTALGKNPSIHCVRDRKSEVVYLSEIRICFDKNMTLVDCDGVLNKINIEFMYQSAKNTIITNCEIQYEIIYPSVVPADRITNINENNALWKFPLVDIYKTLEFIKWVTL